MPARLHHELLLPPGATQLLAFTHGIFGSGGNWRSIARQVIAARTGWGAVLIDLRLHGRSEAGPVPHTLAACTDDLVTLFARLATAGPPVTIAVGHSFGGKVVLGLDAVPRRIVLDSTPSRRPEAWSDPANTVRDAWESMMALDRTWNHRDDFVAALVARGHAHGLASWLAMNLTPIVDGLRLRLDLAAVRELLSDYYLTDRWSHIDDATGAIDMIVAEHGHTVSTNDQLRLEAAPALVTTQVVPGASHWLHLDSPAVVIGHVIDAIDRTATE